MGAITISLIIMISVFISYISFIWSKYGIQTSISQSYYALPQNLRPLFTLFCWGFAIPAMIAGSGVSVFMFLAGAGIAFVGAAAQIKLSLDYKVHMVAAISGVIFSQLAIFFGYHLWYVNLAFILLGIIILFLSKKNYLWWIELVAFGSICYAIASNIL